MEHTPGHGVKGDVPNATARTLDAHVVLPGIEAGTGGGGVLGLGMGSVGGPIFLLGFREKGKITTSVDEIRLHAV